MTIHHLGMIPSWSYTMKRKSKLEDMFMRGRGNTPPSCSEKELLENLRANQPEVTPPDLLQQNLQNKHQGDELEKFASALLGLDRTPGSGCGFRFKGDLQHPTILIEIKSTRKIPLFFKQSWMTKAREQARAKNKLRSVVIFGMANRPENYGGKLYFFAELTHNYIDPDIRCTYDECRLDFLTLARVPLTIGFRHMTVRVDSLDNWRLDSDYIRD